MSKKVNIPRELLSPSPEFDRASESMGLHWWHWEGDIGKLSVSPAMLEILGLDPATFDYSLDSIYKNIHPDDVVTNREKLRRVFHGQDIMYENEYRVKDNNGEWQWYYNRGTVLHRNEDGKPVIMGGIAIDISGRFKHLMAMVEEKEKLEFIFKNTNEAILVFEMKDGQMDGVVNANKAAMNLFGRDSKDLNKLIPDVFLEDEVLGVKGKLFSEVSEKGFGHAEKRLDLGDGKCIWLDVTAHRFNLTGADLVLAIVIDKTSNRRIEAALRESERLYRTLFEAANDRIGLFTAEDQRPLLLNSAFYESLGYTRKEFLEQGREESVHPEDRPRLNQEKSQLFKNGYSSHEYRVMHKDGHYLHMSAKIVLIKDGLDEKDLILFIVRDISDRKQVMNDLKQAKDHAEESDQLKSAFLANMSHEIRTPMNSIIGFSNLLVNPNLEDTTRVLYVNRIVRNSELLLTLISDIIDLAKIESDQLSIVYGKSLLTELISDMEQYAQDEIERLGKKDLHVVAFVGIPDCVIETDVIRIAQVMKNLVNNAIKFTERGTVEIGCKKGSTDGTLVLYVKDTGIGIAKEHFDLIFNQFRQIDGSNTRKFGGTGLGLAICNNLVRLMGGKIWVESEEDRGALFQLELPAKSPAGVVPEEPELRTQVSSLDTDKKLSIMVVDDESDSIELYKALLTSMGYSVAMALTGYDALKLLEQKQQPDLVLMDVSMPVLSGTDTLRIMKERYPDLKVVAQSAHALLGDRDRFLKEGFDEYLPKPFTEEQLTGIISKLFND